MKKVNAYTIFCFLFLLLFLSFTPRLTNIPLAVTPGISLLAKDVSSKPEWLKEMSGYKNKTQTEIEVEILRSFRIIYAQNLIFITIGITSGLLLLMRKRIGKYFALTISFYALGYWFYDHLASGNVWERLYAKFTIFFPAYPLEVIQQDIVANIIYLSAIIFLLRPSISREFNINQEKNLSTE